MEIIVFIILLVGFVLLYMVMNVSLLWTILILIFACLIYISLRYPRGKEDWTQPLGANLYLLIMAIVIMFIFLSVNPGNIHIQDSDITYRMPSDPSWTPEWSWVVQLDAPVLVLSMIFITMMFLIILGMLIPSIQELRKEVTTGEEKPKIGMGA
jgi:1,4-dihydroxy-2-naphthoate octaprenyltransferase